MTATGLEERLFPIFWKQWGKRVSIDTQRLMIVIGTRTLISKE